MDPSPYKCFSYNTLIENNPMEIPELSFWYNTANENLKYQPIFRSIDDYPNPVYCDVDVYQQLKEMKDSYDFDNFRDIRNQANPFENIPNSFFYNRASIKLTNIDAIYKLTGDNISWDNLHNYENFTFCDIAAGPGGFTHYIQWRCPNSYGYGITLKEPTFLDWKGKYIDFKRFDKYYGNDKTGDLYKHWGNFINHVLKNEPEGVNLVMGDGGFDLEGDVNLMPHQEFLSSRLLAAQIIVGIKATKIGGNFIVKIFDSVTELSGQLIYLLSLCFEKIIPFKASSSRPANSERYLICLTRLSNINTSYTIISSMLNDYTDDIYLDSCIDKNLIPNDFNEWLTYWNNYSITRQIQYGQIIVDIKNGTPVELPEYDTTKFLTIWNLPNVNINRKSKIF